MSVDFNDCVPLSHEGGRFKPIKFLDPNYQHTFDVPREDRNYKTQHVFKLVSVLGLEKYAFIQLDFDWHIPTDSSISLLVVETAILSSFMTSYQRHTLFFKHLANRRSSCCEMGRVIYPLVDNVLTRPPEAVDINVTHSRKRSILRLKMSIWCS